MKKVFVLLTLILVNAMLFAGISGGFGGPTFGYYKLDNTQINNILQTNTGEQLKDIHYTMGGSGYGLVNGFLIGGSGYSATQSIATDSLSIHYSLSGGAFEFGKLWDLKLFHLGVLGKLGSSGETFKLSPKPLINTTIDDLLQNPGRTSQINRGGFETGASLIAIVPIKEWMALAVKGGVSYGLGWEWSIEDGGDIISAPQDTPLRIDVNVSVLFGGISD